MSVFLKMRGPPQISSNIFREMMDFVQENYQCYPPSALWGFCVRPRKAAAEELETSKSVDTDLWVIRLMEENPAPVDR